LSGASVAEAVRKGRRPSTDAIEDEPSDAAYRQVLLGNDLAKVKQVWIGAGAEVRSALRYQREIPSPIGASKRVDAPRRSG